MPRTEIDPVAVLIIALVAFWLIGGGLFAYYGAEYLGAFWRWCASC